MKNQLKLIQADLTTMQVDAIVNAANTSLLGGGGVDGAIHRGAGPELLAECRLLGGCDTGNAKITKAYQLPSKYIIHTVGPVWDGGRDHENELLASCYRACLNLAVQTNIRTIAFPAISCGVYGFPIREAAHIAIGESSSFLRSNSTVIDMIYFVLFGDNVFKEYRDAYNMLLK